MSRTALLTIAFIVIAASTGVGQGAQYRLSMKTKAPFVGSVPSPEMMVYTDGSHIRTDMTMDMPGLGSFRMSSILDPAKNKIVMLQHADKAYSETVMPAITDRFDSTDFRRMAGSIKKHQSSNTLRDVIDGRAVRRVVTTGDFLMPTKNGFPVKVDAGNKAVMVTEHWVADEPALIAIFSKLGNVLGQTGLAGEASRLADDGFPLKTTMVMVQVPQGATIDPEAILKAGDTVAGLMMSTSMTITHIKIGPVDPGLFTIPKDYNKR